MSLKKSLLCAALTTSLLLLGSCRPIDEFHPQHPMVGKPAPNIEGKLVEGTKFQLQEQIAKNSVVMLDFWATWCGPCVKEMPILIKLAEEYESRGVALFAVNVREDVDEIRGFLSANDWKVNVVLDPQSQHAEAYDIEPIPQLFLIGNDGIVHRAHIGLPRDIDELEPMLRKELDELLAKMPAKTASTE